MSDSISRRDFLKASSAVGLAAAINPASAMATTAKKSRVVIATDTAAVSSSGTPNPTKIKDLVDHAIMTFTGKSDIAAAYEAIFPAKVTTSTKIYMKRNGASGTGSKINPVDVAVLDAFQAGLESMLDGTFPKANIDNPKPPPGNVSCKSRVDAATYIINCPIAWMNTAPGHGVTLSLKNTINYDGDPMQLHHNENPPTWLYKISLSAAVKPKQIFALLDAVVGRSDGGPHGNPNFIAGTIIVGSDLVAVDYNGLRLLEKQGAKKSAIDLGDKNLKEAEKAGLGTCTEANMEVITITAPWPATGTINGSDKIMESMNVRVVNQGNKVDFAIPGAFSKHVSIFDMMGNLIWQSQNIPGEYVSWNHNTLSGVRVPSAMYIYRIACNGSVMRGTVMVTR